MPDPHGTNGGTPATQPWFVRSFGRRYQLLYDHRDDASAAREIAALAGMMRLSPGCRVLDIACGAGRHTAALRHAGFDAIGVDLSEDLLRTGAERASLRGCLVRGDIRRLPFAGAFDAAVNLFTSFGYFGRDADNAAALRSMAGVLRPGGWLALDHAHRAYIERTLEPHTVEQRGDLTITSHRRIVNHRVIKQVTIDGPAGLEQFVEDVRLYHPEEMAALFDAAGLGQVRIVGSFDGQPLDEQSDRMITMGQRR
jgi:SAM-dependent methyltransferase